jgi:hypothetical protein
MEAHYRRLNEKNHGAKSSCVLKATAEAVESLKDMCYQRGAWAPNDGAATEDVLDVICSLEQGLSTVNGDTSLRLKSYETIEDDELSPMKITSMLHEMGPLVGVLFADDEAYCSSAVYRGDRDVDGNHVVVCTGYLYVDDELVIVIMDNDESEGPVRFVLYEAFEEFHVLTVDASS